MNLLIDILKQDAPYLDTLKNRLLHIGFLCVFVLTFLTVYAPFDMNSWYGNIQGHMLIGCTVLLFSQLVVRRIFNFQKIKLYTLIIWGICEILIITGLIYLIYAPGFPSLSEKVNELLITLKFVCLITVGPYILFIWYLSLKYKFTTRQNDTFNKTKANNSSDELLTIKSENNKVHIAIKYNRLLYIKSSGNYLDIYYLIGEVVTKAIVRISLKELEEHITSANMLRIHRSYIINKHKISSFKKTRKGYGLVIQHASEEILPVSSSYKQEFEKALELNMPH